MKNNYFYITTPIYYVNDKPHIGHAYTTLICDAIARSMRLLNKQVMFSTGTDEYGQKIAKSAAALNISTQEFVNNISSKFQDFLTKLEISHDDFIRTTELRHKKKVQKFWDKLLDAGYIYLSKYSGWYSTRDEAFYHEDEITHDHKAPTGSDVEWIEEDSYFFALSKLQDKLLNFYEENPNFIEPESKKNEVISFVKNGLQDLSISRNTLQWGIDVPNNSSHKIYVWLDALVNYLTVIDFDLEKSTSDFWQNSYHFIGKDILRFHAIYWPAFLLAVNIEPPKKIFAHGWWLNDGEKMSKSLGNVIDPIQLINKFGLDNVRYFLLREIPLGNDGNYSEEKLIKRVNSELSNKIGNLLQRTMIFVYKNCDKQIPIISQPVIHDLHENAFLTKVKNITKQNLALIEDMNLSKFIENIIIMSELSNQYIDDMSPWNLIKTNKTKMNHVLYCLVEAIRYLGIMLQPIIPNSAQKILDLLSIPNEERTFLHLNEKFSIKSGTLINEPKIIFAKQ